ncbi:hypothetical protein ECPA23_2900, partial [Escherichia coli PA23]
MRQRIQRRFQNIV